MLCTTDRRFGRVPWQLARRLSRISPSLTPTPYSQIPIKTLNRKLYVNPKALILYTSGTLQSFKIIYKPYTLNPDVAAPLRFDGPLLKETACHGVLVV